MNELCKCGSQKEYKICCEPYILGHKNAPTAETLMRSRYTAHTLINIPYLLDTTHSSTCHEYSAKNMEEWAKNSDWQKLEIISRTWGGINDTKGEVQFKAFYFNQKRQLIVHHELSYFAKEDDKWYYITGKINPTKKELNKIEDNITPIFSDKNEKASSTF